MIDQYSMTKRPKRIYALTRMLNPITFQGAYKKQNYFEGWYYKLQSEQLDHIHAIIAGISLHKEDPHAFIQHFDGQCNEVAYYRFPVEEFQFSLSPHQITIRDNVFSLNVIKINLEGCVGEVTIDDGLQFPYKWYAPNVMGLFGWIPFLEDYHALGTMKSKLRGSLTMKGQKVIFDQGEAYIEKDYGAKFPQGWTWGTAHNFNSIKDAAVSFAVAELPIHIATIQGYLAIVHVNDTWYRFASYTRGKLEMCQINNTTVQIIMTNAHHVLEVIASYQTGVALPAPTQKGMAGYVVESLHAQLHCVLKDKRTKHIIFEGESQGALEIGGTYMANQATK